MKTTQLASVFLLGASVSGCAHHPPKLSPPQTASYDGVKAEYRDLTRLPNPCDVDGAEVARELESVNALMGHFLDQTAPGGEAPWTQQQLEDGKRAKDLVGPAVDAADNDIQALSSRCPYLEPALRLQDVQKRGRERILSVRQRLQELPGQIAAQQRRTDVASWKAAQGEAIQQAHDTWCPPKPRPGKMPDIYYAAQDENGRTAWLFCDGAKILTREGAAPQFVAPSGRRHHSERAYLSAANHFPPEEIKRAPTAAPPEPAAEPAPQSADSSAPTPE